MGMDKYSAWVIRHQMQSLSGIGIILGALFFAISLTPTLVPRSYLTQGSLAGARFAIGYGAGTFWRWLWHYLELPEPSELVRSTTNALVVAGCFLIVIIFLWRAAGWQNSIRAVMKMEPVETAHPFKVCAIALITFLVILLLARLFSLSIHFVSARTGRFIPRRVANVVGLLVATMLLWSIANNILIRTAFNALEFSFREFDAFLEPERPQPMAPGKTGSAVSLVKWNELGRAGREFVARSPSAAQIGTITGRPAQDPVRIYVGLRGRDTPQARAKLALEELKRQHGLRPLDPHRHHADRHRLDRSRGDGCGRISLRRRRCQRRGAVFLSQQRAGPGCLDSSPRILSGSLPGFAERGAFRFCRGVGRA